MVGRRRQVVDNRGKVIDQEMQDAAGLDEPDGPAPGVDDGQPPVAAPRHPGDGAGDRVLLGQRHGGGGHDPPDGPGQVGDVVGHQPQRVAFREDAGQPAPLADQHRAPLLLLHPLERFAHRFVRTETDRIGSDQLFQGLGVQVHGGPPSPCGRRRAGAPDDAAPARAPRSGRRRPGRPGSEAGRPRGRVPFTPSCRIVAREPAMRVFSPVRRRRPPAHRLVYAVRT